MADLFVGAPKARRTGSIVYNAQLQQTSFSTGTTAASALIRREAFQRRCAGEKLRQTGLLIGFGYRTFHHFDRIMDVTVFEVEISTEGHDFLYGRASAPTTKRRHKCGFSRI
mmetsp:Transcript_17095/g.35593  ORF Transcript_17095/g.35593 Transcript_17095/m.35593 type:complete len:112 (+) Transcript_17095:1201-1536(+)